SIKADVSTALASLAAAWRRASKSCQPLPERFSPTCSVNRLCKRWRSDSLIIGCFYFMLVSRERSIQNYSFLERQKQFKIVDKNYAFIIVRNAYYVLNTGR